MRLKTLEFEKAFKKIGQSLKHPIGKIYLLDSNLLPKDYSEIRNTKTTYFTENLEGEIAWIMQLISINKDKVNAFIKKEEEFQTSILLNEYNKAGLIIEDINKNIGFSYWAMENTFSIKDKKNESKDNWGFLKEVNDTTSNNLSLLYAEFFSKKAEKEVSTLQFKREIESLIIGLNEKDTEIVVFRLGNIYYNHFKHLEILCFIESTSSIIDQYLFVLDLLLYLLEEKKYTELANSIVLKFNEIGIIDSRIDRFSEVTSKEEIIKDFNSEILELFDTYTIGNYSEAISMARSLLLNQPSCIELYEIYIKSLIELNSDFIETGISQNIDEILSSLYVLYSKTKSFYDSEEILNKFYLSFPKLNISKQIISLVFNLSGSDLSNTYLSNIYYVNSKFSNPNLLIINNKVGKRKFDEDIFSNHLSLMVNYYIGIGDLDNLRKLKANIPENKYELYKSRIGSNYLEKIDIERLEKFSRKDLNILYEQELLVIFFNYCFEKNQFGKLVGLVVDSYFKNPLLLKILPVDSLMNRIIALDYALEAIDINLPIFFYIANSEDYFQFASLDEYLNSLGLEKPSQIQIIKSETNFNKVNFLLEKICNLNVLNNFYLVFENDKEVLDERIEILRKLISVNSNNSERFFEEIAVLSRKRKVDSTIQNYNDGKITLNFDRIREENIQSLETSFNRFIKLRDYSENNELKVIESDLLIKNILSEFIYRGNDFQDASFVAFKSIFLEMVNVFLFSKEHGLDGDLSTRIRHGVLENKIRSVFLNNSIISTKNNDNYADVDYWIQMCSDLNYIEEISKSIQHVIKSFSEKIDNLISKIKNEYIQIISYKHNSKEKAYFNYTFTEEYLWLVYNGTKENDDYNEFQNIAFDILRTHTEELLQTISKAFRNELTSEFINLLNNYELEISSITNIGGEVLYELKQKLKFAKTQIEHELLEVSKWFKLTSYFDKYTLDVETIIHTAIEIINNESEIKINPKLSLPENNFLLEKGYSYIEIFKILIENAIKHSKVSINDLNLEISFKEPILFEKGKEIESIFDFSISNNINSDVSVYCNMDEISKNWNTSLINVNVEGGSGYEKINRILKHGNKVNSKVDFEINDKFLVTFTIYSKYKYIDNEDIAN